MSAGLFVSTAEVPPLGPGIVLEGEPRATKKEAEQSAAKAALAKFQGSGVQAVQPAAKAKTAPVPKPPRPITTSSSAATVQPKPPGIPVVIGVPAPKVSGSVPATVPATSPPK